MNIKLTFEKKTSNESTDNAIHSNNTDQELDNTCEIGPSTQPERREEAFEVRQNASTFQKNLPLYKQMCNGDGCLYPNKIANYSKSLPHNDLGEVDLNAYNIYINALNTSNTNIFESIPLGGTAKLINPLSSYSYDLVGADSHHLTMKAAPAFSSAEVASEMAEDYWLALTRDIPFNDYNICQLTNDAATDLTNFSDFKGPKNNDIVTTEVLFRGKPEGNLVGPYISQFLYQDIPFGAKNIVQKYNVPIGGRDFMTSYDEWLDRQNGIVPTDNIIYDPIPRYISNGRDMSGWVHRDFSYQGTLSACLILLSFGKKALAISNPYLHSETMDGFVTFGAPHILDFVSKVSNLALKAAWFQKYLVHRRLRPEEFGGRVQNLLTCKADYPINTELLNSSALSSVFSKFGTYLLPMAFPEGCPSHPSYPSGHATYVGAGVTILKAFFNESFEIPNLVVASSDGLKLCSYCGEPLTVGGELNKLASNIALGRDTAGFHYRSDGQEGMELGQTVAIGVLQDYRNAYAEKFSGFSFTKFDGTKVII